VALKAAISLDGRMATGSGQSKWITGPEARREVHRLRAAMDAVLVGVGTFLADDPALDVRDQEYTKENIAVLVDPRGRGFDSLAGSKLLQARPPGKVVVAVSTATEVARRSAAEALGVRLVALESDSDGNLQPEPLLTRLWSLGVRSVLVEGGPATNQVFLKAEAVQRVHLFQAPILLGGEGSFGWTGSMAPGRLEQVPVLRRIRSLDLGRDLYRTGLLQDPLSGASYRNV
jgi:diaminohydroxyphosphoribosylaminopyrimidine deaminase/5-amino-6-(5-phosphoribosylamino)uracil reductase